MKNLTMLLNSNSIHPLTIKILYWYSKSKRNLPWRENADAYAIWLSEIIFQQTRIDQGLNYYVRLIDKFPTVYDLANAEEREVLKAWEGLGYYSRACNLHHAAKTIVNDFDGKFPEDYDDILSLKGVGPYTAAAISSIAFANVKPAIDGNVLRVCSRLFLIEDPVDKASTKAIIEKELYKIIDREKPGDFNQAMMELGALLCKPQNPLCELCPISEHCIAYHSGMQDQLPKKSKKVVVKDVFYNFLVIDHQNKLMITKRNSGIWKEMYQFPLYESDKHIDIDEMKIYLDKNNLNTDSSIIESDTFKHVLSHRVIYAKFWIIKTKKVLQISNTISIERKNLVDYPMPRLIHRFLESEEANKYLLM